MKRRLIALAATVAVSAAGTATLVAGQASAAGVSPSTVALSSSASASSRLPFAGRTFLITVDDGTVYRNTYSADGTTFTSLTVAGDGVGESFTTTLQTAEVGWNQYFVSWVEPGGITVSQVINFTTGTVKIFFTFADSTGAREGQLHTGTIALAQ
jgi:hypothetical protein